MPTMRDRFTRVAAELVREDERLALVLADIGTDRFEAEGLAPGAHPRVINVGIREQLQIGVAAGMALEGMRPIAHSYAPFLVERPFEQLKLDLSHQGVGAILVSVGASYDWAEGGRTHHCPADISLLSTLPDWEAGIPGHPDEAEALLRYAAGVDHPYYLRLSDRSNQRAVKVRPGEFEVLRRGNAGAPTVVAIGPLLDPVREAVADFDVSLVYVTSPLTLDERALLSVGHSQDLVFVEPYLSGTTASQLRCALSRSPLRMLSVGVSHDEHRHYGTVEQHDEAHGLTAPHLHERIARFLTGTGV